MAQATWKISGDYFESCSCDYLCPCIPGNLAAEPTKGHCSAALVFHINEGSYNGTSLQGLSFAVLLYTPGVMISGDWTVGVITDSAASTDQQQALLSIASGQAGGPMAPLGPLISNFQGVEAKPIHYRVDGLRRSVSIPGVLEQSIEGVPGAKTDEPIYIDNVGHPASTRLALAHAKESHLHAFGINWDETSGQNNGHFAPFSWQGA
jgi:hypothetical protein